MVVTLNGIEVAIILEGTFQYLPGACAELTSAQKTTVRNAYLSGRSEVTL